MQKHMGKDAFDAKAKELNVKNSILLCPCFLKISDCIIISNLVAKFAPRYVALQCKCHANEKIDCVKIIPNLIYPTP